MTSSRFNPHVAALDVPAIPLALRWAEDYDGRNGPLIDLSQAVPNYPPHATMLQELASQSSAPETAAYGAIEGEAALRRAYAIHLSELYAAAVQTDNIHITAGCNQAFVASLIALAQSGDSILLSNPCYFNHEASARMLGLEVDYINCEKQNAFVPTWEATLAKIHDQVRIIALVSPNNPTGARYPNEYLTRLLDECQRRGIWLILDETYRDFLAPSQHPCHALFNNSNWPNHFVQLYSFSKSLCIPGHRLGALAAGKETVAQIAKVMDNLQICAPRAAQNSAAKLLAELSAWRADNAAEIAARESAFVHTMASVPAWQIASIGAYFAYIVHPFPHLDVCDVVKRLVQEHGILLLPGRFFGQDQNAYLRVAFANVDCAMIGQIGDRLRAVDFR